MKIDNNEKILIYFWSVHYSVPFSINFGFDVKFGFIN